MWITDDKTNPADAPRITGQSRGSGNREGPDGSGDDLCQQRASFTLNIGDVKSYKELFQTVTFLFFAELNDDLVLALK